MENVLNLGKVLTKSEQQSIHGADKYRNCTCDPCDLTCSSSGLCPDCEVEDMPED